MKGTGCGAICSAHARVRTRAGALQPARHHDGEVAAAGLGQDGVARGGSSSARGGGSRGSWGRHVRRQRSRRWPGEAAQSGGQAAYSAGGGKQRSRQEEEEIGSICNFRKF